MQTSRVGGIGDLSDGIRTSSTLAITKDILAACPALKTPLQQLLDATLQLVGQGLDTSALSRMQFVRPSSADQLCPELPQIAHYLPGAPAAHQLCRQWHVASSCACAVSQPVRRVCVPRVPGSVCGCAGRPSPPLQASTSWRMKMASLPQQRSRRATTGAPPCWCT